MVLSREVAQSVLRTSCALVLVALSIGAHAAPVQAADVVKLELGGTGSTSWNEHVKPCFSGIKAVTLHNAGVTEGRVVIWISNIVSSEGLNPEPETGDLSEPGEMDKYLLFNLTGSRVKTNIALPATVNDLPQSVNDGHYLIVESLPAGATVALEWQWRLPCETGNDVQGDILSFDINYTLEQTGRLPGGGRRGGFGGWPGFTSVPGTSFPAPRPDTRCCGVLPGDVLQLSVEIMNLGNQDGSNVTLKCTMPPELIVTAVDPAVTSSFAGQQVTSMLGLVESGKSKFIRLTVRVAPGGVPQTCLSELLEQAPLAITDDARPVASNQYTLSLSGLTIDPSIDEIWPYITLVKFTGGQARVSVKATSVSTAWRYNVIFRLKEAVCCSREITRSYIIPGADEYTLTMMIDGMGTQSKKLNLARGASQDIAFVPASVQTGGWQLPGRISMFWWIIPTGTYVVDVNGLQGQFTSEVWINWLAVAFLLGVAALFIWRRLRYR